MSESARGGAEAWFDWVPDEPCAEYFRQLHPPALRSGFARWKLVTTVLSCTRRVWEEREAQRGLHELVHGPLTSGAHVGVVCWIPDVSHAACLGCTWVVSASGARDARLLALSHEREHAS